MLKYADVVLYKSKWTSDAAAVAFLNSKANLNICRIGGGEQPPREPPNELERSVPVERTPGEHLRRTCAGSLGTALATVQDEWNFDWCKGGLSSVGLEALCCLLPHNQALAELSLNNIEHFEAQLAESLPLMPAL